MSEVQRLCMYSLIHFENTPIQTTTLSRLSSLKRFLFCTIPVNFCHSETSIVLISINNHKLVMLILEFLISGNTQHILFHICL